MNYNKSSNQRLYWHNKYMGNPDIYGTSPSIPAQLALRLFGKNNIKSVLELGAGQGRDTIYLARNGFNVTSTDYAKSAIIAVNDKSKHLNLSNYINTIELDVKQKLPFSDCSFDACYSHVLFCMDFNDEELDYIFCEINRVLKPGGMFIYSVRSITDNYFQKGMYVAPNTYEIDGAINYFFSKSKIISLAKHFKIKTIKEFETGSAKRKIFFNVLIKAI